MKYISLLRGINVSGQKKIKMLDLREMYTDLGFESVASYIQTGNVVFESPKVTETKALEAIIKQGIKGKFDFDVSVMVRTREEWQNTINNNPLFDKEKDIKHFCVTLLGEIPEQEYLDSIADFKHNNDQFTIIDRAIYLYCPDGYGRTKLTNNFFEKKLKVRATTRNWRTILKLREVASQ